MESVTKATQLAQQEGWEKTEALFRTYLPEPAEADWQTHYADEKGHVAIPKLETGYCADD